MKSDIQENHEILNIWFLAIRPKTLPAAIAPVIVGLAFAYRDAGFDWSVAIASLIVALLLQIGSNLANDVFDYQHGADAGDRLGPTRVTQAGLLTPGQVKAGMYLVFLLAGIFGYYIAIKAGWGVIIIGVAAILSAIAYTGGPFPLAYYGLGDLFVFVFFGLVATVGTYYVQTMMTNPGVFLAGAAMGLLIVNILVVNNLRDVDVDRESGKRTMVVRFGTRGARVEYIVCLIGAYAIPLYFVLMEFPSTWVLLSWLSIPLAIRLSKAVFTQKGRELNLVLAGSGRLALIYGILFALGVIINK
jgi:1,4-dihydroxy-2-naphthoate octaprenyltransferase